MDSDVRRTWLMWGRRCISKQGDILRAVFCYEYFGKVFWACRPEFGVFWPKSQSNRPVYRFKFLGSKRQQWPWLMSRDSMSGSAVVSWWEWFWRARSRVRKGKYDWSNSICLLIEVSVENQASRNSLPCLVLVWPKILVAFRSNLWFVISLVCRHKWQLVVTSDS